MANNASRIRLVVLDWAGTAVDHGSFAPVVPFVEAFARFGVTVSQAEARGPMGLPKRDHVAALMRSKGVAERWRSVHGRDGMEADVDRVYAAFVPLQLEVIEDHVEPVPGLLDAVEEVRRRGVKITGTTGYFRAAAERAAAAARRHGYAPDATLCPDDVRGGRPAPWMIFRLMELLDVCPPAAVVKVGDTVPDVDEGRNAGVWTVGVTHTGSEVGCTAAELAVMSEAERSERVGIAGRKLLVAGAHDVIRSAADLPALLDDLNRRLARGERP
jgi:phosphonoacetaldehyde hydrolase